MPIPTKKISIDLLEENPSIITPENMKSQLTNIGLTCKDTSLESLQQAITDVESQYAPGTTESYGILRPKKSSDGKNYYKSEFDYSPAPFLGLEPVSNASWKPSDTGVGYTSQLEYIQFPEHFDYLLRNKPDFAGHQAPPITYSGKYDTIESVKNLFINNAINASSVVVKGLDKPTMTATLHNIIDPLTEDVHDYDVTDNRVIFLLDNYNPDKKECDGIGVLTVNWHLTIKDYKEKKDGKKHDTELTISARAVVYDDINILMADYQFVKSHFKDLAFNQFYGMGNSGIPVRSKVEIFTGKLPPACEETFNKSLPLNSKEGYVDVIVLYSPDLNNVGCIDNSSSDGEAKYSKSITSGFTFSTSQTLSTEFSFEASAEVVKAGFKIGFSITFTEQWNKSSTETVEFSVPAGKKAFLYQGFTKAATLRYMPETDSFKYIDYAKFVTNNITTTNEPIEYAD